MKLKLIDYLLALGIVIVLLVGIFCIQYYFNYQNNECFAEPLVYGAKQMEDKWDGKFSGYGFIKQGRNTVKIIFDSDEVVYGLE